MSDKETKQKKIEHPAEELFDIEPGSTIVEYQESLPAEITDHQEYDEKDNDIEEQFQEVYSKAIDAFDTQNDIVDTVEGKYAARNAEVAVQFLNAALNAAKERANMKQHKDKLEVTKDASGGPKTVNNNIVVDRNDILRTLMQEEKEVNTIDED